MPTPAARTISSPPTTANTRFCRGVSDSPSGFGWRPLMPVKHREWRAGGWLPSGPGWPVSGQGGPDGVPAEPGQQHGGGGADDDRVDQLAQPAPAGDGERSGRPQGHGGAGRDRQRRVIVGGQVGGQQLGQVAPFGGEDEREGGGRGP